MRVLVVGEELGRPARLARSISTDCCTAVAIDFIRVEAEIRRAVPQVVLVILPDIGGAEHVRTLCSLGSMDGVYVISVVGEHMSRRTIASVIAAGSHDVVCAPYAVEELRARIDVQRRLRGWLDAKSQSERTLSELRAWEYLGDVVADELEVMLGRPVEIEEGWLPQTESVRLATISMTLPMEQVELCVSIVAEGLGRAWLGEKLLGDSSASDELLDDVMREMANMAGGALKRAAASEGPVLATGIPVDGRTLPARDSGARSWRVIVEGFAFAVVGEIRRRANRRLPARRLVEGMVVVTDVHNSAGVLLLQSGTRLTSTTAQRLSNLLDSMLIEVVA